MTATKSRFTFTRTPLVATAAAILSATLISQPHAGMDVPTIELAFATHVEMNLPEQDVFIERTPGTGQVFRVTQSEYDLNAPLFATADAVPHNPFDPIATGPYAKGRPLGMTLGQWLNHEGEATYACVEGEGQLRTSFSGLIPGGVYSLWKAYRAMPHATPASGQLDLPLGPREASASVFVADRAGIAHVHQSFHPCLQLSDGWTTTMLAVNWHSDGDPNGASPGEFGRNAHIPLYLELPSLTASN